MSEGGNRVTEAVYNADGLSVTLTDAKGNRTTFEYDGHDRRVKLRYPHPSAVNTSSTTDYEQVRLQRSRRPHRHGQGWPQREHRYS